jgi:hypothetical protein
VVQRLITTLLRCADVYKNRVGAEKEGGEKKEPKFEQEGEGEMVKHKR